MGEDSEIQEPVEKIFVSVRLRPLSEKERARNSTSDWACINNDTVVFKSSLPERSMLPTAYTFDRVFDGDCPTSQVYEEGAKDIALSVLNGFNSSIFAYGQTSSGKTYTMRGITDRAVADICDYIERHKEREFLAKFSAMEIYNEAVRDLLSTDSTPLRLLDDPEKGTVVEKLTEETLRDKDHVEELLSICEAQRQIGETALNETSSRSHQILRLTIESSAREYAGAGNSSILAASVNFIDLAGSERASQTLTAGARLKEGCHINRSLLTLGTVIRKLSKGKKSHVPYRDSKLTRILQNALGGNARTAIICTMSPDRSHIEQSRNTLLFASCAKEVETNAQVNLVMSDKALVKQLQKELAKLKNQMKSLGSNPVKHDTAGLLREKDLLIGLMAKEIKELTRQRDLAQSQVENLLLSIREAQMLKGGEYSSSNSSEVANVPCTVGYNNHGDIVAPRVPMTNNQYPELLDNSQEEIHLDGITAKFVGSDPCKGWDEVAQKMDEEFEDNCKEVRCIEFEDSSIKMNDKANASSSSAENNEGKLTNGTDELSVDPMEPEGNMIMKEALVKEIEADNLSAVPAEGERKVSLTDPEDIEGKLTGRVSTIEKQEGNSFSINPEENQEKLTGRVSTIEKQEGNSFSINPEENQGKLIGRVSTIEKQEGNSFSINPEENQGKLTERVSTIEKQGGNSFSINPEENQGKLDMIISMKGNVVSSPKKEDLQSYVIMKEDVVSSPKKEDLQSHVIMKENVVSSPKKEDLQSHVIMKENVVSSPKKEDLQSHVIMKENVVSSSKKEDLQSHVIMKENVVSSPKKEDLQSHVIMKENVVSSPKKEDLQSHVIMKENVVSPPKKEDLQSHVIMKENVVSFPKKEDLQSHVIMKGNVVSSPKKEDLQSYVNRDEAYEDMKQKIQELEGTIKYLISFHNIGGSPSLPDQTSSSSTSITKIRSCREIVTTVLSSPAFEKAEQNESIPPSTTVEKDFLESEKALSQKLSGPKDDNRSGTMSRSNSQSSFSSDFGEAQSLKDIDMDDNYSELSFSQRPRKSFASGSARRTSFSTVFSEGGSETNPQSAKQIDKNLALETKDGTENSAETNGSVKLHSSWPSDFEKLQRKIIELWDTCNVPLIHRTYFILLFKGDLSDSVYMEVEVRRLSFLQNTMPSGSNVRKDIPVDTTASSANELIRERRLLWKQLQKKFSKNQREELYKKWGIKLNTKQRSLQLARRVWTNTQDMGHVKESANLVAKLLGFVETRQAPKEIVGLSILPRSITRRSSSWKRVISPML